VERLRQVRDRRLGTAELLQDAPSCGVRERRERDIEQVTRILNHLVQYIRTDLKWASGYAEAAKGAFGGSESPIWEGLTLIANMRMCANVPAQHAIQTALGGYQSVSELIVPGGRFHEQSKLAAKLLNEIPGVSCVEPRGALYCFPRLDPEMYPIVDDQQFVIELLRAKKILVTHGTGFNWFEPDHFRLVTLPAVPELEEAIGRIASFLESYA